MADRDDDLMAERLPDARPRRKAQLFEVSVFLFLIVPPLLFSLAFIVARARDRVDREARDPPVQQADHLPLVSQEFLQKVAAGPIESNRHRHRPLPQT